MHVRYHHYNSFNIDNVCGSVSISIGKFTKIILVFIKFELVFTIQIMTVNTNASANIEPHIP